MVTMVDGFVPSNSAQSPSYDRRRSKFASHQLARVLLGGISVRGSRELLHAASPTYAVETVEWVKEALDELYYRLNSPEMAVESFSNALQCLGDDPLSPDVVGRHFLALGIRLPRVRTAYGLERIMRAAPVALRWLKDWYLTEDNA